MRYCISKNLDPGVDTAATVVLRGNSINDPEFALGGHQALGHDEYSNFYKKYCVLGAKLRVTFCPNFANSNQSCFCGIAQSNSESMAFTGTDEYIEQKMGLYKACTSASAGQDKVVLTSKMSIKKLSGKTNLLDEDSLISDFGDDPAHEYFYHIFISPINDSENPLNTNIQIIVDYIVMLLEPKELRQS